MSTYLNKRAPDDVVALIRDEYQGIMHWHRESLKLRLRISWQFVMSAWQVFMKDPTWENYFKYAGMYAATFHDHGEELVKHQHAWVDACLDDLQRMAEARARRQAELAEDDIPDF